jgi:hypothetical protein
MKNLLETCDMIHLDASEELQESLLLLQRAFDLAFQKNLTPKEFMGWKSFRGQTRVIWF